MNASSSLTTPGSRSLNAPSPTPVLRLSGSWLAAQGRLPLAFMGYGLGVANAGSPLLVFAIVRLTNASYAGEEKEGAKAAAVGAAK